MRFVSEPIVFAGKTREEIEQMPVSPEWRKSNDFVCKRCEDSAYIHPFTDWIWGCRRCGTRTRAIMAFFRLA